VSLHPLVCFFQLKRSSLLDALLPQKYLRTFLESQIESYDGICTAEQKMKPAESTEDTPASQTRLLRVVKPLPEEEEGQRSPVPGHCCIIC